eukprot:368718-Rhodomonas_salina.1
MPSPTPPTPLSLAPPPSLVYLPARPSSLRLASLPSLSASPRATTHRCALSSCARPPRLARAHTPASIPPPSALPRAPSTAPLSACTFPRSKPLASPLSRPLLPPIAWTPDPTLRTTPPWPSLSLGSDLPPSLPSARTSAGPPSARPSRDECFTCRPPPSPLLRSSSCPPLSSPPALLPFGLSAFLCPLFSNPPGSPAPLSGLPFLSPGPPVLEPAGTSRRLST